MSFDSFYGGRMGASFIIVKRFEGITIPNETEYKFKYYAVDPNSNDGNVIYYTHNVTIGDVTQEELIERTGANYTQYTWRPAEIKANTPYNVYNLDTHQTGTYSFTKSEYAEGMVECFKEGGSTTNDVNYGEYVIIDTLDKNDPDNGKVYRRGMDYTSEPLHGAEYIGQIVGPQGDSPELSMNHYDVIDHSESTNYVNKQKFTYTVNEGDIVPGYIPPAEEGQDPTFNDTIKLISANIKDKYGNIYACTIGFKVPYLIDDYEARSMSPYENRTREIDPETGEPTGPYYNYDLINPDPSSYSGGQWNHPFYHKWQLKIPHGYHGINSTDFEIVHTKTMPQGFKSSDFAGTKVYEDAECTRPTEEEGQQVILTDSRDIVREKEYDPEDSSTEYVQEQLPIYDPKAISCQIVYRDVGGNKEYKWVKQEDCYKDILRYRETDFDDIEEGKIRFYELGSFNTIQRVSLDQSGTLSVFYKGEDSNPNPEVFTNAITWVNKVTLTDDGLFTMTFNNDSISGSDTYQRQLKWVKDLELSEDESQVQYHLTGETEARKLGDWKVIDKVEVQTGETEGTGNQKLLITYKSKTNGVKDTEEIGNPLNYIIESIVNEETTMRGSTPIYRHLLVYYADPAIRETMRDRWVTYTGVKVGTKNDWVDLGPATGRSTGTLVLTNVTSLSQLPAGTPPEALCKPGTTVPIDPNAKGWGVTYTENEDDIWFYCYDYDSQEWYKAGEINPRAAEPETIIVKSNDEAIGTAELQNDGFWFKEETVLCAE